MGAGAAEAEAVPNCWEPHLHLSLVLTGVTPSPIPSQPTCFTHSHHNNYTYHPTPDIDGQIFLTHAGVWKELVLGSSSRLPEAHITLLFTAHPRHTVLS